MAGCLAEKWVRRACTLVVAGVAAYASYRYQREYAGEGGSDPTDEPLWPLSVDGLLVLAKAGSRCGRRSGWALQSRWQPTSPPHRVGLEASVWLAGRSP
ncbi:MAG: DUF2637 domain-containing protein [Mycobacterium sp.]|nr:DUF2637 domain-containing protein [Mycobacterium sp.]